MAARLASILVGIMSLEGGIFRQIIPVAVAGLLAAWDLVAPGASPAPRLVAWIGRPPVGVVTQGEVRLGQGLLALACLAALVAAAAGAAEVAWVLAIAAGVLGIAAGLLGRPAFGIVPPTGRRT